LGLFDPANNGLILGEGGVALVIEREADAVARGATIYARFAAWAMAGGDQVRHGAAANADASKFVLGEVGPADAVIVEGSGLPAVDKLEQALFPGKVAGAKAQVGDWPGASTLLEVAHGALALHTGQWLEGKSVLVHGLDLSGTASAVRLEAV
jgi:3-oxoacyl-(acyl-carrier-protein) synthase